ncbi:MAG: DEAD/DEAH box helicase family protein, partial [Nitrosopumilus sp.]
MKDLDYQIDAIRKLKQTSNDLLNLQGNHTIVFKAPTGSGKTVMMAEFLKEFVSNRTDDKEFSFIWTAPRKLHTQSKKKLTNHYKDTMAIKCSGFEDLSDRMIGPNEILFLNWESINREENIYYRENEQEIFLEKVIGNTKDDG